MGRKVFDAPFGDGDGMLPVEAGRYRLIWSHSCPWSQRQAIALKLLGLDRVISMGTVNPLWTEAHLWDFSDKEGGVDPVLHIHELKEAYDKADPDYEGDVIVPTIVDERNGKAVNTDHAALLTYWELAWKPFQKKGAPDLYPAGLRSEIDTFNDWLLKHILLAPYRTSGASTQADYDGAYTAFFKDMDDLDERLGSRRFLMGDYITDPDLRFYVFLVRFDLVFHDYCGMNRNLLSHWTHIWAYARELHRIPAFRGTTFFEDIKKSAQLADPGNPHGIVTLGPDLSSWDWEAAGRKELSSDPEHVMN